MTILHAEAIAGLFGSGAKPVFLLGAGASVRSGVPLAGQLVESIVKFAYCKATARAVGDPTLMRSDWIGWLEKQHSHWYRAGIPAADLYPSAVEYLLQPNVHRREFFHSVLRGALDPSPGYQRMVSLMAKRSLSTVLTTNFDNLVARSVGSTRAVGYCNEIKTPSDYAMFETTPASPQVIYLHGSVDHYTDKNLEHETQRLDDALVNLLQPLLRDQPLVVVGYRGAEPSVMRHLLMEQASTCKNFRHGIYWCHLRGADPTRDSPLVAELRSLIGTNLQFVEIEGFDELMASVDRHVANTGSFDVLSPTPAARIHENLPFDMQPSPVAINALNDLLLRAKLVAYAEAMRVAPPALDTPDKLVRGMQAHTLAAPQAGEVRPTRAAQMLFCRRPEEQVVGAHITVRITGEPSWVASVLDVPKGTPEGEDEFNISGNLWEQLDAVTTLLSRVNRPFRLKGAVSHTAYPYPPLALKELLTNLIAHRSYTSGKAARIIVTREEITFENPGGLVESVKRDLEDESLQEVVGVGSRRLKGYRNPVIADFFYSAGAMDKAGSGLPDVVQEAANNLNVVAFGPDADNVNFVAAIRCRPESLLIDEGTRTAKPQRGDQRYSANLLRTEDWPAEVWRFGTTEDAKKVNKLETAGVDPFGTARNWVWTFVDQASPTAKALFAVGLEEECRKVATEELLLDRDANAVVPQLLNMALDMHLRKLGLRARFESGRFRAYYPAVEGAPREISYRSMFRQSKRTVAKPVTSRSSGQVIYWEHKAVYLRFEHFAGSWALSLLPGYVFTVDGDSQSVASERIGPLSTKRASRDYNPTVMHDLVFWSRMLAGESDGSFRLSLTKGGDAGPVVKISADIPSFVFQESAELGAVVGEETDPSVDSEEFEILQEEIEQAVAEAALRQADDEATNR